MKVTVCGAGAYGLALGKVLGDKKHKVSYYDPIKFPKVTLRDALAGVGAVVIAVPAGNINVLLRDYPESVKYLPTLLATKGLLSLKGFADFKEFGLLSGAGFADDLMSHRSLVLTSTKAFAKDLFEDKQVKIELTDDVRGVLYCGSLKNVYAIGAGYKGVEDDDAVMYAAQALQELHRYLRAHGAEESTADLSCGWRDLLLTCTPASRNYRCGAMLAEGRKVAEAREALGTVEGLAALSAVRCGGYPILKYIKGIVAEHS